jgi:hypothetical protein
MTMYAHELSPTQKGGRPMESATGIVGAFISFLNVEGYNLVVYPTKTKRWGYKIGGRFGPRTYATANEAKLVLFDDFWLQTQDDDALWTSD